MNSTHVQTLDHMLFNECFCKDVEFGTYTNTVSMKAPFPLENREDGWVGIDSCIASEIAWLWKNGVRTLNSCCGHRKTHSWVIVSKESEGFMDEYYESFIAPSGRNSYLLKTGHSTQFIIEQSSKMSDEEQLDKILDNVFGYLEVGESGIHGTDEEHRSALKRALLAWHQQELERAVAEAKEAAWIALDQGATCCADKHQTFYGAIVTSSQWEAWQEKQKKEPTRDMSEVEGMGVMSSEHFQEFLQFCIKLSQKETENE